MTKYEEAYINVTQYVRPNGRKEVVVIPVPEETADKYDYCVKHTSVFGFEVIQREGEQTLINFTCEVNWLEDEDLFTKLKNIDSKEKFIANIIEMIDVSYNMIEKKFPK